MADPVPESKVSNLDPNYERRFRELKDAAAAEYQARTQGGQTRWFRPGGWEGNLFDLEAMGVPFSREKANQDCIEAIKDSASPGVVGDVVVTTTQIDVLSCFERAFRMRHTMRRPRAMAHMLGRKHGHGHDLGPLVVCYIEYLRQVLIQAKEPR